MAAIRLENVEKWFGEHQVIRGLSLDVDDGEFAVFVGPSGCGKSTLLRMIAGLEETSAGRIILGGQDVTDKVPAERALSMVFQSYALYPHMTVRGNIGFGLKTAGMKAAEIEAKVAKASAMLQLEDYLERRPKELSGGQRQRVAIGRAVVREPRGFLFDEPLSNLDAALRGEMRFEIAKLHEKLGATMIYVTHDQVEAMTLADKIVVLRDGRIEQTGDPRTLYERPETLFTAQFIGSPKMNILPCSAAAGEFSLPGHKSGRHGVSADMRTVNTLGVRPEHIETAEDGGSHCTGVVEVCEYLGADSYVYVNCAGLGMLTVRLAGGQSVQSGTRLGLKFDESRLHFFNKKEEAVR